MYKKVLTLLFSVFFLVISFFTIVDKIQAATFVPCDPYDALCGLDCELDGSVCGHWINDTPSVTFPSGQKLHPTSGNCIYDSNASCQSVYGAAYYDGNEIDGCSCNSGAYYNTTTGHCEYPNNCPVGQKLHPSSGNCIYDSNASCQAVYGAAYYDGNEIDGCACNNGAIYNHDSGLCEFPAS